MGPGFEVVGPGNVEQRTQLKVPTMVPHSIIILLTYSVFQCF